MHGLNTLEHMNKDAIERARLAKVAEEARKAEAEKTEK